VNQDARPDFVVIVFGWAVALPTTVESARAKTTLKDGVLELTLPKVEKLKCRTVTVE
jgi:HSP20 family molecular chaperone IbpA